MIVCYQYKDFVNYGRYFFSDIEPKTVQFFMSGITVIACWKIKQLH